MSSSEDKPTGVQPKQRWLRSLRRPKVQSSEPRAAAPQAQQHRDSRAGPGAQAAAAESRAAAPHSPRARGRALLRSLRRGCRAILGRVTAAIRQTGTQRPLHRATGSATAAAAPAAGAQSQAAAPHCPLCVPGPSPAQLEELGQWAGPAGMALLEELGNEEQHWSDDFQDGSGGEESLSESSSFDSNKPESDSGPGQLLKLFVQDTDPSVSDGEDSKAQEWWHKKNKDGSIQSTCVNPLFQAPHSPCCPASPQHSQQEGPGQWAGPAGMALLKELGSEERHCSDDFQAPSDGGESLSESSSSDPNELQSYSSPGQLPKLFLQDPDQSVSHGEDSKAQEWWHKKNEDVSMHTTCVNPLFPAQQSPCCPPSPMPSQLEDLGPWAGPAGMALLKELESEEENCSDDFQAGSDGGERLSLSSSFDPNEPESDSGPGQLLKLFLQDTDQSVSDEEDSKAQEWWHKKNEDGSMHTTFVYPLFQAQQRPCCPLSPLRSQLEDLGQWAGPAGMAVLKELGSEEENSSDDFQPGSDGGEMLSLSSSFDANGLESYSDPGQLQDTDPSVSDEEESKAQEVWLKKNEDVTIRTIWVNPLCPALMVEPSSLEAEEADSGLPSTSPAPAAPTDTQPAAPENEEQHVSGPAQAQGVAQTAASAASGAQAAAAESRAAAPRSPCFPPSPRPSQLEELRQRAGPAAMALLAELRGVDSSCCKELSSGPATEWPEDTELSRSAEEESSSWSLQSEPLPGDTEPGRMAEEESTSGSLQSETLQEDTVPGRMAEEESSSWSLQSEPLPEDTVTGRMAEEEIGLVALPREAWVEDEVRSCSTEDERASWLLPCESWAESIGSEACTAPEDGRDQLEAALLCPSHVHPPLLHMGAGVSSQKSEEGSLSQMEDMEMYGRQMQAVLRATWWEEELLRRDRRSPERLQGLHSAAAVPVRRPRPFRRALRALRRAIRNLKCLVPGLHLSRCT